MLFAGRIRRLRDEKRMLQRQFAVAMDIDAPMYSKIERGKRCTKREQIIAIAKSLKINRNDFLIFGIADQIIALIEDEKITKNIHN
ncbi:MAG: helix-turn-helix domain-containing protein [Planctomycetaceae bacterium]|jgi:transcriptional regulator with XRE-family HTH domain|nr:helix-turn-helix domain-containing protein [Planctomycetaceae bacterium]